MLDWQYVKPVKDKQEKKLVSGVIEITRKGVGYVAWDPPAGGEPEKEDIEIETNNLAGSLNGDTVEVSLTRLFPRPKGKVVRVIERAKEEFVATLKQKDGVLVAVPDDIRFYRSITLEGGVNFSEGEKVLVRLMSFDGKGDARGAIVQHLGRAGEHQVEMNAIVLEHGFSTEFPEAVTREARELEANHAKIIEEEAPKRADYRGKPTFTIDPKDAKDFDDALSVSKLPDGSFEIGVHIADATYFCVPGTALDDEATKRGTSVYLVDATIPMLPHELSGNVCSLKANEDRLAFSAVFRMNDKAEILERKFQKSIIRSQKRFTYEEAQEVLTKAKGPMIEELGIMRALARILRKGREKEGAIDFGDNEVKFELDEAGKPLGVTRKTRIETMLMIEEFMLLANREVATYISKLAQKVPEKNMVFLYRIHDQPKEDRIEELATFVRAIGYDFANKKKRPSARDIAKLLADIKGKPEEHLIRTATLRSMAKAIYSTKNIGHFGLAFEYYTHFTSPIRRYPDMLAHRILASHLDGKPLTRSEYSTLEKMCIAASAREAEAVAAERESIKYKQVEYMSSKIGQTFEGIISGVTDWGLYVEEKESASEGLVRVRTIGDDFYNYSPKEYALVGQRTKKKYALGDPARIKLVAADLSARTLDFELVK
ncbi:MAG: ribonuclease R [Parcubacteria group bacterium Gr01-1014_56]|nr:MAG: ribonuclease R [Parcubacteria group bacterium Gr01-1014_56]